MNADNSAQFSSSRQIEKCISPWGVEHLLKDDRRQKAQDQRLHVTHTESKHTEDHRSFHSLGFP